MNAGTEERFAHLARAGAGCGAERGENGLEADAESEAIDEFKEAEGVERGG